MRVLPIWAPRYSTNECVINQSKLSANDEDVYLIEFYRDKKLKGKRYRMTGAQIKQYGLSNTKQGDRPVYAVPMDELAKFEEVQNV